MLNNISQTLLVAFALGIVALVVSLSLTRLMLWLLPKCGMLDKPDFARHIHTRTVPRGGGIGMLLSFAGVVLVYFGVMVRVNGKVPFATLLPLAPLAILLPLGVLDDRFGLKARTKFLFQTIAAALAWHFGCRMDGCFGIAFPTWLGFILSVLWIVAFINAFNMIDGVDGLAAGVGFISAACMAVIALVFRRHTLAIILVTFAFSLLGFLYYNWHPARLFMGDTGSMFIGYMLAISGLRLNAQTLSVASIGVPLLVCGIPAMDILLAVWRRVIGTPTPRPESLEAPVDGSEPPAQTSLLRRLGHLAERLGTADQSHIHHRLLRHFRNNQHKTILDIYAMALLFGAVGIGCCFLPDNNLLLALAIVLGTFSFILNRLAVIELWNSTEMLYQNFQSAHTGIIISYLINPLWDLFSIAAAYFIASRSEAISSGAFLRYTAIQMAVLCCSRSYRVFWNFAVSDDYFRLGYALIAGSLLAYGSDFVFGFSRIGHLHSHAAGITVALVLLERLFIHYFRNAQTRRHASAPSDDGASVLLTAIVGVTPLARLYRNLLASDIDRSAREQIAGLIVTDRHFLHSYCFGMKVLGHVDDIESIINERHIGKVVLAKTLGDEELRHVQACCRENSLKLSSYSCQEVSVQNQE